MVAVRRPCKQASPTLRRDALAAFTVASCFASLHGANVLANPTGAQVVAGAASFNQVGKSLNITNAPGTVINWQGFSIGSDELTRFIQSGANSAVLNRVIGSGSSNILGQLLSNGRVFLINPNGVFIGGGAVVDVAGFAASTLQMTDSDFLAGRFRFNDTIGAARIINQGTIQTPAGGQVYLIAPNVENHGVITSPGGEVILAAGKTVELVNAASPNVRVELTAPENEALNVGQVVVGAGRAGIYGTTIRNSGIVSANAAVVDAATGRVVLRAKKDITLEASSRIEANGPKGGEIKIQAEGGTLLADGVIEAKGVSDKGGAVQLLGERVGLFGHVVVDVSGDKGGGTVDVGGDFQGKNKEVQNAQRTYVGPEGSIRADAISEGDGGKVVVWSEDLTRYKGSISVRGGARGGDGGSVEVSGKRDLEFRGTVDASAPNGKVGTLLLDPLTITIANGANGSGADDGHLTEPAVDTNIAFADGGAASFTISEGQIEALTANITLEAGNSITLGNLTTDGQLTLLNNVSLTMRTRNDATTGLAGETATGGISFANSANEIVASGSGAIVVQAGSGNGTSFTSGATSDISVGKLTTAGGGITLEASRDVTLNNTVAAGAGTVRIVAGTGSLSQAAGTITSAALGIRTAGAVNLTAANNVGTLAVNVSGAGNSVKFKNEADGFDIGSVAAGSTIGAFLGKAR